MFLSDVLAVTYGGDSVSIVNPFAITGDDNSITSLACAKNGFAFADAATTCSFYSIFPVAGPITLNGGRLWLNSDLILTNTGSFTNLGTIKGQNHVLSLSPYMTTFNYQDNPSGVTALSLVERQTLPQTLNSVDWSSDGNYVAVVSDLAGGGTPELRVYSFNGTSLSLVASTNISVSSCFSVRWRPTTGSPSTYHLALTASFGDRLRLYSFTPPSTLSEVAITAEVPTSDTYNAVSWQGRGNYLVLGGPATYLYYFNGTTFSAATSFDNDGTVSRNAIQWAPTGNKDDFIVGTDSGHLYLFNALDATPTMSLQRDYNFGGQINALDWAPTSTYIALGFQDGSIKTYQHAAEFSTIIQRNSHPYSQAVDAVSWKNDASRLVVGYVSGAADEFSLLSFDDEDYSLDQIYAADVGQTINALRYSPDGDYIARLDNSSNFLSIYRPIFSQFIFDNVNLFLNGNLTLSSALTFQGACTVNGQGNKMTFTGDGTISVAQGSNVEFKLMDLSFDRPNAFALQGPTSTVSLRNSKILLNSDVVVGGGAMNFYDDVVISGSHTINYQSEFTSTIHRLSTLTLEKDAMLQIGKVPSAIRDPLEFESSSAVLNFDNATLHITSSGLRLTKGAINIYNQSIFDIDSTASQDGLILGNGTSGNDVLLKLHGSAARLDLVGGALTLDGYSPDVLEFTGQPQFAFDSTSSLYAKRPLALDGGWLIPSSGATLYVDPSAYVTTSRTRLEYPDSLEDFVLSGTLESFDEIVLDNGGRIDISSGALAKNVQVNAFDNIVSGNGRFNGSFDFVDRRSTLSWDVIALLDNGDVDLHGGQLILTQPSGFVENYTFVGTGTVNTGIYTFDLGTLESTWTGSIYWDGQRV